ncbi:hypothetical protein [Micromonospora aurantiaca (nom. illeg.)]|uniref:hypothetical protein n=1 Tax=Micromonospora aurantiaca (nom. illeg.) TaxID=47850 RepID=UPI0033C2AC93
MSRNDKPTYRIGTSDAWGAPLPKSIEAAYLAADRAAEQTGAIVYVDEFTGDLANRAYDNGWRPRKHVIAEEVNGELRALPPERYVRVSLCIENSFELYEDVETRVDDVLVPEPPTDQDSDEYGDWAYEHIHCFTGVGHSKGDSWYDVEITASDQPELVGRTFEFGY